MARVDLLHVFIDEHDTQAPCLAVGMTLTHPMSPGEVVQPMDVCWPTVTLDSDGLAEIVCGNCGRYFGESLNMECAKPHACVPVAMPNGVMRCRAGCET